MRPRGAALVLLAVALAGLVGYSIGSAALHDVVRLAASEPNPAAPATPTQATSQIQVTPTRSMAVYRNLELEHGVEYRVQVFLGDAVLWIAGDNPKFAKGCSVRPISIMAVATRKDLPVARTHFLEWRELTSAEGFGMTTSVLGPGFDADDPEGTPRSSLELDVRPALDWGSVRSEDDVIVSAALPLEVSQPLEHPKPMVPRRH